MGGMSQTCRPLSLLAVASFLLAGCGDNFSDNYTEEARQQFDTIYNQMLPNLAADDWLTDEEIEEIELLLHEYSKSGDAHYATPQNGLTMLHLACMFKQPELVRCLLKDGAPVNAHLRNQSGDTPLQFAIASDYAPGTPSEKLIQIIDALLEAGAPINQRGSDGTTLLCFAGVSCEHEEVFLHLLQKGAELADTPGVDYSAPISPGAGAAIKGWDHALAALFEKRNGQLTESDKRLLHLAAIGAAGQDAGRHQECIQLLLKKGAPIDTTDDAGRTALFLAALAPHSGDPISAAPIISLLLKNGADPYKKSEKDAEYPGFCAYDFIISRPELLNELKTQGLSFTPPPLAFDNPATLLQDICRAYMRMADPEEIRPHMDRIITVLTPNAAMLADEIYADALSNAVELMAAVDRERTTAAVAAMPIWKQKEHWLHKAPHTATLLHAIEHAGLDLPADLICSTAEMLNEGGLSDEAATLLEQLGNNPANAELISRYCEDSRPALQAGAWGARLAAADLPAPRADGVQAWMNNHTPSNHEAIQKALLLTSQEELWYGEMEESKQQALFEAMESIGAPRAAAHYRQIAVSLDNPEKLDELTADADSWKFELEIATARFIWENKEAFHPNAPKNTD